MNGATLSEPYTNLYYEKIVVFMYVCVCVCVSAIRRSRVVLVRARIYVRAPALTVTFNVNDHFRLEMIVNIHIPFCLVAIINYP